LNFRDQALERMHGLNLTVLGPKQPATGAVHGLMAAPFAELPSPMSV
jgi:hypothetical protein